MLYIKTTPGYIFGGECGNQCSDPHPQQMLMLHVCLAAKEVLSSYKYLTNKDHGGQMCSSPSSKRATQTVETVTSSIYNLKQYHPIITSEMLHKCLYFVAVLVLLFTMYLYKVTVMRKLTFEVPDDKARNTSSHIIIQVLSRLAV